MKFKIKSSIPEDIQDVLNYILGKPHKGDYDGVYFTDNGYGADIDQWFPGKEEPKTHKVEFDIDYHAYQEREPAAYDWQHVVYDEAEVNFIYVVKIDGVEVNERLERNSEFYNMVHDEFQKNYEPDGPMEDF